MLFAFKFVSHLQNSIRYFSITSMLSFPVFFRHLRALYWELGVASLNGFPPLPFLLPRAKPPPQGDEPGSGRESSQNLFEHFGEERRHSYSPYLLLWTKFLTKMT